MIGPETWPDFYLGDKVRRPPPSLYIITMAGLLIAVLMTWEGLFIRLFGDFKDPSAYWLKGVSDLGIDPLGLAWPWIVLGVSWIGALAGLWLKLSWGIGAVKIISILSLFYVGIGTIMALVVLLCVFLPSSSAWMDTGNA
jgi:hypothetical protein